MNTTMANCSNCGGTLEYNLVMGDPGIKPPMSPRELPKKFIRRIKYTGNVMTMIGIAFTIPFFWTVIFPIIGIICWRKGIKEANNELIPLEHGTAILGQITSIERDYTKTINNKSPFVVEFLFEAGGQKHIGNVGNIFDPIDQQKKVGDKVWVVYMPENPALSSLWPPLK
ncbi:MAG: hypothetical protein JNJ41_07240 [Bacteroidia bacterium]|nr:hypothetical protein [Bacteroidia bacterium]